MYLGRRRQIERHCEGNYCGHSSPGCLGWTEIHMESLFLVCVEGNRGEIQEFNGQKGV